MKLFYCFLAVVLSGASVWAGPPPQAGPQPSAPPKAPARAAAPAAVRPDSIYAYTDVRPRFVGGDAALTAYVRRTLRYPPQALSRKVAGKVFVTFVLSAAGRVQDVHVSRGLGFGLDDEALRVVWLMPPWEPALVQGQPVRVVCTLPISFSAE